MNPLQWTILLFGLTVVVLAMWGLGVMAGPR
jgi:hypothetical protein